MGQTGYIRTIAIVLFIAGIVVFSLQQDQSREGNYSKLIAIVKDSVFIPGPRSLDGSKGFPETVQQIMERERISPKPEGIEKSDEEYKIPLDRSGLQSDPNARSESTYPPIDPEKSNPQNFSADNPQTVSTNWTAATVLGTNPTNALPADNMGAVGPTQFIVAVNGRIVSFDKTTGTADGVINASTNTFFNSVRNGSGTSDPRIRYDRMSQKWFIVMINVSTPNRILFAVSNTSTINGFTIWTFFYLSIDTISPPISSSCLADYPTLGIDNSALYIGTNNFCPSYNSSDGYVVNKANLIAGSLSVTVFRGLVPASGREGPYTPQGVDDFDVSSTEGYFIGVSDSLYSRLIIRRVSNPGTSPSISSDISLTVNQTYIPQLVRHLGAASNRRLDGLDDRLFAACMRNGRLWTAHNFMVNSSGVATSTTGRNGTRWYEIQNLTGTPSLVQSGTIYDNAASNPISYWIPSVMVNGQGHAAFVFSSSGIANYVNMSTCGRLSTGTLGTTQTVTNVTASSTAYVIEPNDAQRWGDYSYVSLDPNDDMTMWGVMGFCDATNSYGVRVAKLLAPAPPSLVSASPSSVQVGQSNVDVVITGSSASGEGFYDPGSGFANRISASISGGVTVNSVTYNSSTQVTVNITTTSASTGSKTVIITNPDGQSVSSSVIFDTPLPVLMSSFTSIINKRNVTLNWRTEQEINNKGFDVERKTVFTNSSSGDWAKISFVDGNGTVNAPKEYSFTDAKLVTGIYNYRLKQIDYNGNYEYFRLPANVKIGIPMSAEISQNYPNPFNPLTRIDYSIPAQGKVTIVIYDITGREVTRPVDEIKDAGYFTAEFNASNLASGVYFYRIIAPGINQVKKMLVIK